MAPCCAQVCAAVQSVCGGSARTSRSRGKVFGARPTAARRGSARLTHLPSVRRPPPATAAFSLLFPSATRLCVPLLVERRPLAPCLSPRLTPARKTPEDPRTSHAAPHPPPGRCGGPEPGSGRRRPRAPRAPRRRGAEQARRRHPVDPHLPADGGLGRAVPDRDGPGAVEEPVARPAPERRHRPDVGRLHPRTRARRPRLPRGHPRPLREHHARPHLPPARARHLPQAAHPRGERPPVGRTLPQRRWKGVPCDWLGADALRGRRVQRLLPRRQPRTVPCPLYHGQRLHRVWHHHGHHASGRRSLDSSFAEEPRVVGLLDHHALGYREYLHRTSRRRLVAQGYATHCSRRRLVGRRPAWHPPRSQQPAHRRPLHHHDPHRLGLLGARPVDDDLHQDPRGLRRHAHARGRRAHRRGLLPRAALRAAAARRALGRRHERAHARGRARRRRRAVPRRAGLPAPAALPARRGGRAVHVCDGRGAALRRCGARDGPCDVHARHVQPGVPHLRARRLAHPALGVERPARGGRAGRRRHRARARGQVVCARAGRRA